MSRIQTTFERLAPMIGEHTDDVLKEFGLDASEVAALRAAKAI